MARRPSEFTGTALDISPPLTMDLSNRRSVTALRFCHTSAICRLSSSEILSPCAHTPSIKSPRLRVPICAVEAGGNESDFFVVEGSCAFHCVFLLKILYNPSCLLNNPIYLSPCWNSSTGCAMFLYTRRSAETFCEPSMKVPMQCG